MKLVYEKMLHILDGKKDLRVQAPHGHVPNTANQDGTLWLKKKYEQQI